MSGLKTFHRKQALEHEIKDLYLEATYAVGTAPEGELDTTTPITFISSTVRDDRNDDTITLSVSAAAANPTDTVLINVTGDEDAVAIEVVPNNGINNPDVAAEATLNLTEDIVLTSAAAGTTRNDNTFTTQVLAAAANPTDTVLAAFTGTSTAITCTITPNDGTNNPTTAATATLNLTEDIVLTDNPNTGVLRNTATFTIQVLAAAANPTDTVLVAFTAVDDDITCTITPNDGTNNTATPVDLTTAELVELINTGAVVGKNVTVTDASSLRELQTATGGDTTPLADAGEGDAVVGTFSGGTDIPVALTSAELVEAITTGTVSGKHITITDTNNLLDDFSTSTGGGAEELAHEGEGDGAVATLAGGIDPSFTLIENQLRWGVKSIEEVSTGDFKVTLSDTYNSIKNFEGKIKSTTAQDITFQVKNDSVNNVTAPSLSFYTLKAGVKTNPINGTVFKLLIEVKNTTII